MKYRYEHRIPLSMHCSEMVLADGKMISTFKSDGKPLFIPSDGVHTLKRVIIAVAEDGGVFEYEADPRSWIDLSNSRLIVRHTFEDCDWIPTEEEAAIEQLSAIELN